MRGDWVDVPFRGSNPALVRLLLGIYIAQEPVSRKAALTILGAEHISTSTRLIVFALKHGWLKSVSGKDKRKDFVLPTEKLTNAIRKQITYLAAP